MPLADCEGDSHCETYQSKDSYQNAGGLSNGADFFGSIGFWIVFVCWAMHLYVYGLLNVLAFWLIQAALSVKRVTAFSVAKVAFGSAIVVFSLVIPVHAWLYVINRILEIP